MGTMVRALSVYEQQRREQSRVGSYPQKTQVISPTRRPMSHQCPVPPLWPHLGIKRVHCHEHPRRPHHNRHRQRKHQRERKRHPLQDHHAHPPLNLHPALHHARRRRHKLERVHRRRRRQRRRKQQRRVNPQAHVRRVPRPPIPSALLVHVLPRVPRLFPAKDEQEGDARCEQDDAPR